MDYAKLLNEIRQQVQKSKWKYLREKKTKFFDADRNTVLEDYLRSIFPNVHDWVFDSMVPKTIREYRHMEMRRYRPDARSESLGMIIEFDGLQHYQEPKIIYSDAERDSYFRGAGYDVIRIPYFIVLSKSNIRHYFHVDVTNDYCMLRNPFFDSPNNDYGINTSPQAFTYIGYKRFIKDITTLPEDTRKIIRDDLALVSEANEYDIPAIPECWNDDYEKAIAL